MNIQSELDSARHLGEELEPIPQFKATAKLGGFLTQLPA